MAVARALSLGRLQTPQVLGVLPSVSKRDSNTLAFAKARRGRGGRSSFSGVVATVFGASGFIGRYMVNGLGKIGSQVIVPYRSDYGEVLPLKLCGDLGQILFSPWHLRDEESIRKAIQYSNVVINLVGSEKNTRNFNMSDVHVDGARRLARISKEVGVEKFIHFSAMNASPDPQRTIKDTPSEFLVSKYEGEEAVLEEFPEAVIIRPADVCGEEDRFIQLLTDRKRRFYSSHNIYVWKKGDETIKRPLLIHDVVTGTINTIFEKDANGQVYEFYGPNAYYLADLIDYMYGKMVYDHWKLVNHNPLYLAFAKYSWLIPSQIRSLNLTRLEIEAVSDRPSMNCRSLADLGVTPKPIESMIDWLLKDRKQSLYYEREEVKVNKPQVVQGEY